MPFLKKSKFPFYAETGEQSHSVFLELYVNLDQNQETIEKMVTFVHEWSSLAK